MKVTFDIDYLKFLAVKQARENISGFTKNARAVENFVQFRVQGQMGREDGIISITVIEDEKPAAEERSKEPPPMIPLAAEALAKCREGKSRDC